MMRPVLAKCNLYLICVCLFTSGCDTSNRAAKPNLADLLDLVLEKPIGTNKEGVITLTAVLINKSPCEVEVLFDGRKYKSAGGFRVYLGTKVYDPRVRPNGATEYDVLPPEYGLLPSHGQKKFNLLLKLPKDAAFDVMAAPESMKVELLIHVVRREGNYSELLGGEAVLLGHWMN